MRWVFPSIMSICNGNFPFWGSFKVLYSLIVLVLATEEKYNEAVYSSAKRLAAAIDGLPDPGWPKFKDNKRESNFRSRKRQKRTGDNSLLWLEVCWWLLLSFQWHKTMLMSPRSDWYISFFKACQVTCLRRNL